MLKTRLRESGLAVREDYLDPDTAGRWIAEDLGRALEAAFPAAREPTPLERESLDHERFLESRASVYGGRLARLDAHAAEDGPPLVVTGESGCGKSALLANWVRRYRAGRPGDPVLPHYIGSSHANADHTAILRHVASEIARPYPRPDTGGIRPPCRGGADRRQA